jgi:DNA-binding transcriptional LysR family regulator
MDPDLRHLRSFLAVVEERHFGRAAQRLGIAQPAVSRHVRALEAALGSPLLVRTSRSTDLTEAGRAAVAPARDVLAASDRLQTAVEAAASGAGALVTVGFVASTARGWLAPIVEAMATQHPDVELRAVQARMNQVAASLRRGELDAAISRPLYDVELVELPLAEEAIVLAVPDGHRLAGRARIELSELTGETLIAVERRVFPAGYAASMAQLRDAGAEPARIRHTTSPAAALGLVAAGVGVFRLPASAATPTSGVTYVPVDAHVARLVLVRRPEPPPAALVALAEVAAEVARRSVSSASS